MAAFDSILEEYRAQAREWISEEKAEGKRDNSDQIHAYMCGAMSVEISDLRRICDGVLSACGNISEIRNDELRAAVARIQIAHYRMAVQASAS